MAISNRKAFNFYRSYFDMFNNLKKDKDKLAFVTAILEKQFNNVDPVHLKGQALFAFISQKHSIDAQISGFIAKTSAPPTEPPTVQEEGQEKEKGKGELRTYGSNGKWFGVSKVYAYESLTKVYEDGINEYFDEVHLGFRFEKSYHLELFWKEWNSKTAKSHQYLNSCMANLKNGKEWIK